MFTPGVGEKGEAMAEEGSRKECPRGAIMGCPQPLRPSPCAAREGGEGRGVRNKGLRL